MHIRAGKNNLTTKLQIDGSNSESEVSASLDNDLTAGANVHTLLDLVARLQRENATLQLQQCIDPMTGLLNRRAFLAELEMEWGMWLRSGRFASLTLVEIKNFKSFIDYYGLQAGNRALIRAARHLHRQLRTSDSLAYLSYNKFAVLLRDTDALSAQLVVDKLCTSELTIPLDRPAQEKKQLIMRHRVGGATLSSRINSVQQWINAAEQGLDIKKYQKRTGYSTRNYTPKISIFI